MNQPRNWWKALTFQPLSTVEIIERQLYNAKVELLRYAALREEAMHMENMLQERIDRLDEMLAAEKPTAVQVPSLLGPGLRVLADLQGDQK